MASQNNYILFTTSVGCAFQHEFGEHILSEYRRYNLLILFKLISFMNANFCPYSYRFGYCLLSSTILDMKNITIARINFYNHKIAPHPTTLVIHSLNCSLPFTMLRMLSEMNPEVYNFLRLSKMKKT